MVSLHALISVLACTSCFSRAPLLCCVGACVCVCVVVGGAEFARAWVALLVRSAFTSRSWLAFASAGVMDGACT
jgi:hypothetical protein